MGSTAHDQPHLDGLTSNIRANTTASCGQAQGDTACVVQDLKRSLASLKRRIVNSGRSLELFDKMNCCGAGLN